MFSMATSLLVVMAAIILHFDAAPTTYTINLQQYQTIQIGWTQEQIIQLLGGPGITAYQSDSTGSVPFSVTIQYSGSQSSTATTSFTFTGGVLSTKSQSGLDTGVYTITYEQYTAIQIGWTRAQVTNLVGTAGSITGESGTGCSAMLYVQYKGTGTGSSTASFTFTGGQVTSKTSYGLTAATNGIITWQQYQTIQIGWTQQQVTQLIGGSGSIASQSGMPGSASYSIYVQYSGSQSSNAYFQFVGGVLTMKTHTGLDTGVYIMTYEQYTAVQIGWTRAQITNLVGTAGGTMTESGTGSSATLYVRYKGSGTGSSTANFIFTAGQVTSKTATDFPSMVSSTISWQQYQTIQIGWTQQQVTQLMGGPGRTITQWGTPGSASYYTFLTFSGSQSSKADLSFVDGVLSSKSQSGLDTGVYTITYEQYTAIQIGWTRAQVTNLVGTAGSTITEAGTGSSATLFVQYKGSGTGSSTASFIFTGGKVTWETSSGLSPAAGSTITWQQYQTIQIGWTQQQVTQLIGGPGSTTTQSGTPGTASYSTTVRYSGSQSSNVDLNFVGGVLSSKSQSGLDTGIYIITYEQFSAVQVGWTRAQVTNLVGTAGSVTSESGTGSSAMLIVQYKGSGTGYSTASFTFTGGKASDKSQAGLK